MVIMVYLDLFFVIDVVEFFKQWVFCFDGDIGLAEFVFVGGFNCVVQLGVYGLFVVINVQYWQIVCEYVFVGVWGIVLVCGMWRF